MLRSGDKVIREEWIGDVYMRAILASGKGGTCYRGVSSPMDDFRA